MKLRTLAVAAAAAGALGLAGCGDDPSSEASGPQDAGRLLASTFSPSGGGAKVKSGTIDLQVDGDLAGSLQASGKASATIQLDRAESGGIPEFSAAVKADGEQQGGRKIAIDAGGTYVGGRIYVAYDGENYDLGQELSKQAAASLGTALTQSGQGSGSGDVVGRLGLQPQTWLRNPRVAGDEQIGGVDTYKITGQVDVKALVPDVLDAARKAQSLTGRTGAASRVPTVTDAQLDSAQKDIRKLDVAIWTGKDDKILRKLQVDLDIASGRDTLEGNVSLTLTKVNERQDIETPSDTKPFTELLPKLGNLLPSAAGTGGTSPGGASGVSPEYLDCVQEAAGDPAKLNRCQASLAP